MIGASPNLHRAGLGGGDKKYKKRDRGGVEASPLGLTHPHASGTGYPLLPNKILSCN